ncbi:hypothetical protein GOV11_01505, partial [Candidatus Woesearchaeota archaeon]|nr:hypothetical protein [Candidatus Woesearchaeota archaeon]
MKIIDDKQGELHALPSKELTPGQAAAMKSKRAQAIIAQLLEKPQTPVEVAH